MIVYHGSSVSVRQPDILHSYRALDFGKGFYLTSDFEQAKKWSILTTERRKSGKALISVFEINDKDIDKLNLLKFESANKEWLEFVAKNRKNKIIEENFDLIIGPVANDNTMPTITLYLRGDYDTDDAIKRLLTQRLKDQFVFKTEKSLTYLRFKEVINI